MIDALSRKIVGISYIATMQSIERTPVFTGVLATSVDGACGGCPLSLIYTAKRYASGLREHPSLSHAYCTISITGRRSIMPGIHHGHTYSMR